MNLTQALHRACQQHPDKTAVVCAGRRLTFRQWADRAARLGAVLRSRGVGSGDRVALLAANGENYIACYTALWWIGAAACPVNTRWSVAEIAYSLRDCGVRCLIVDIDHAGLVSALREQAPCLRDVLCLGEHTPTGATALEPLLAASSPAADGRFGGDHLATLLYTGGTTGHPKGAMLSHANLLSAALARLAATPKMADSVALLSTPLFHAASLGRLLPHMIAGGICVVLPQFRADAVFDAVEAEGVTDLPLVPSMLQTLLDHPGFDPRRLRSVRRIGYGAAPIAEALLERALQALPDVEFMQSYGMTECAALATLSRPSDHGPEARRSGRSRSAGRACSIVELRIVGPQGQELRVGEVGEIVVRGPNVMLGYWNRPEETAQALRGGWLFTGDVGTLDAEGCLYVVDRLKDMIVTGGENVYSAEVENVLHTHPAVQTCAVFAVPSALWGEAVHAVVVLRDGVAPDETELRDHCRSRLAGYKCPKEIAFAHSLPMTAAGKVAKHLLRDPYWQGEKRRVA
jgi:long-chain acyl-CoA synthetase